MCLLDSVLKIKKLDYMKPLIASAIGGICPYLVTLARNLVTSKSTQHFSDFNVSWLFFVGLILLALIGVAVSFLFQETDLRKAFVLGISAPALISNTLNSAESSGKGLTMVLPNLVTTAYAQKAEGSPESTASPVLGPVFGRAVNVTLQSPVPVHAEFFDVHGNSLLTAVLNRSGEIPIPGLAQKVQFAVQREQSPSVFSPFFALPPHEGEKKTFNLNVTGQGNFGFNQAFGSAPTINYQISVK